jgi:hypothetical protein
MNYNVIIWLLAIPAVTSLIACTSIAPLPSADTTSSTLTQATAHTRKLDTPLFSGDRSPIIFVIHQVKDADTRAAAERIIRVFAENNALVDVAVMPLKKDNNPEDLSYLTYYTDAGLIDVCLDGESINWLPPGGSTRDTAYQELPALLSKSRDLIKTTTGYYPSNCTLPSDDYNQENYRLLQEAGFVILSTHYYSELKPLAQPVDWSGNSDTRGLSRFPIVGSVSFYSIPSRKGGVPSYDIDEKIIDTVEKSIQDFGVAVIEIAPSEFLDQNKKTDPNRLVALSRLINTCKNFGDLTTFESWHRYASAWLNESPSASNRILPTYNGGPAIIFRLDDVAIDWLEEIDIAIIKMFERNGVPIDLGVVASGSGNPSYKIPWAKQYTDKGVTGISVHGYDWTYCQLDTKQSGQAYADIRTRLARTRSLYAHYYGFYPVAFTVPTDFYDEIGYKAVMDAGFKVFATHISNEPHPSIKLVDFHGLENPRGMYRIPTASDVCGWTLDEEGAGATPYVTERPDQTAEGCTITNISGKWTEVHDISRPAGIADYCKYYQSWDDAFYDDFSNSLCSLLYTGGVAAISLHPDCFADENGKLDQAKLQKVEPIIKWCKQNATITTFEAWYRYQTGTR